MKYAIGILMLFVVGVVNAQTNSEIPMVPDINGRAVTLFTPEFSDMAAAYAADGSTLIVRVVVDKFGVPVSAACSASCHPRMKEAAEAAARESRFAPLIVNGRASEYQGTLLYTIAFKRIEWYRFGVAMQSVLNFDNISVGPAAQFLTGEFAAEKSRLIEIDQVKDVNERIRRIQREIANVKGLLTGRDLWLFDVGLATREVTFWMMVGGKVDRDELRRAIGRVGEFAKNAPADTPEDFIQGLRNMSSFEFDDAMPERDLRVAIQQLARGLANYPK